MTTTTTLTLDTTDTDELAQLANEAASSARPARAALGLALQGAVFRASVAAMPSKPDTTADLLRELVDWAREHTSPRDPHTPHDILVRAVAHLASIGR